MICKRPPACRTLCRFLKLSLFYLLVLANIFPPREWSNQSVSLSWVEPHFECRAELCRKGPMVFHVPSRAGSLVLEMDKYPPLCEKRYWENSLKYRFLPKSLLPNIMTPGVWYHWLFDYKELHWWLSSKREALGEPRKPCLEMAPWAPSSVWINASSSLLFLLCLPLPSFFYYWYCWRCSYLREMKKNPVWYGR